MKTMATSKKAARQPEDEAQGPIDRARPCCRAPCRKCGSDQARPTIEGDDENAGGEGDLGDARVVGVFVRNTAVNFGVR